MNRLNTRRNIREENQPPRLKSGDKITIEMDDQDGDFSAGDYTVVGMGNPGTYILSGMGHTKLRVTRGALKDAGYSLREDKLNLKQLIREEVKKILTETSRNFEVDDRVKVVSPSMVHSGKSGIVVDISPSDSYYLVEFPNGQAYFHESDLKLVKRPSMG